MLIIYKEISVLVRTVSGRPQYVEVESSEFEFLNRFELLSRSEQFLPSRATSYSIANYSRLHLERSFSSLDVEALMATRSLVQLLAPKLEPKVSEQ